jgi:16S rRNA (adenine1518-N6/adenine1519-N6)-dimethyltransferase
LLQKEVVGRLCANPSDDDWGRLAVLTSLLCDRTDLFDVPPGAFRPVPKVMSSVVRLTPLPQPRFQVDRAKLEKVTAQAFGQRRKMLRASLKGLLDEAALSGADIDPTRRPETLSLAEFVALARLI